ncbi:prepilin peptidase [Catelliglobosispora koreensis]|uniref:prepilin peptidase n=1 Tax=Catelliglobosispora koreensis TaxID=129052 RepID=UPI0012F7C86C|nr:A24 family peptidase [Catelliglobosispora koreensis]
MLAVVMLLLGLAVGSFLNVVIHRVPSGGSLLRPPSRCPVCENPIRHRHNIPVIGWLVLRGRCADCGTGISVRYPVVEAATAVLFLGVTVQLSRMDLLPGLPAYLFFTAAGVALAVIDIDHRRLPDAIVLPSYPVLAVLLAIASAISGDWWALGRAGIGAAALFLFFLLLALIHPAGMGFGDVKLAGLIGGVLAYISWTALIVGGFAGFVFGAVAGAALMAARRTGRKTAIPFGPFMIGGALFALPTAGAVASLYLGLLP